MDDQPGSPAGHQVRLPQEETLVHLPDLILDGADEGRVSRIVVVELESIEGRGRQCGFGLRMPRGGW